MQNLLRCKKFTSYFVIINYIPTLWHETSAKIKLYSIGCVNIVGCECGRHTLFKHITWACIIFVFLFLPSFVSYVISSRDIIWYVISHVISHVISYVISSRDIMICYIYPTLYPVEVCLYMSKGGLFLSNIFFFFF